MLSDSTDTMINAVSTTEIRKRRNKLGLSPTQAAKAAGWKTMQQWWDVEHGRRKNPTVSVMVRIAGVLGCKVDDLLRER